jgi:hypothetical protein
MSSSQPGEGLVQIASDLTLSQAINDANDLEDKVIMLRELGYDVDASDFSDLVHLTAEINAKPIADSLSDEYLSADHGGFAGDIVGSSIKLGLGIYFGGVGGAAPGMRTGKELASVIDQAVSAALKNETYMTSQPKHFPFRNTPMKSARPIINQEITREANSLHHWVDRDRKTGLE